LSTPAVGANLALLVSAWTATQRTGSWSELGAILDERVVWQRIMPGQVCHGRGEVLSLLGRQGPPFRLTHIEARESGDEVAMSVEGPGFPATEELAAAAPRSLLFTFRDERIVNMRSFASREEAFAELRP
jgi:ketosteroid isomerase-like protein